MSFFLTQGLKGVEEKTFLLIISSLLIWYFWSFAQWLAFSRRKLWHYDFFKGSRVIVVDPCRTHRLLSNIFFFLLHVKAIAFFQVPAFDQSVNNYLMNTLSKHKIDKKARMSNIHRHFFFWHKEATKVM